MPQTLEVKGKSGKVYEFPIPDGADMADFQRKVTQFMHSKGETATPAGRSPAPPSSVSHDVPQAWNPAAGPTLDTGGGFKPFVPPVPPQRSFTGNLKDFVNGVIGKLQKGSSPSAGETYLKKAIEAAKPRRESGGESYLRKAGGKPKPPIQMSDPDFLKRLVEDARKESERKEAAQFAEAQKEGERQLAIAQQEDTFDPNPPGSTFRVPTDAASARSIMRENMDPGATLERSVGALAQGSFAPGATLSLTPDQKDAVLRGIGNALPRATAAALISNPSSLVGVVAEMGGWAAFGGVPETPEEWAMVGGGIAALHQVGKLGKFLFPLTKGAKPADAAQSVARELATRKGAQAEFTPKPETAYAGGEVPNLVGMAKQPGATGKAVPAGAVDGGSTPPASTGANSSEIPNSSGATLYRAIDAQGRSPGEWVYTTDSKKYADAFAAIREGSINTVPSRLQNPIDISNLSSTASSAALKKALAEYGIVLPKLDEGEPFWQMLQPDVRASILKQGRDRGHDGIIFKDVVITPDGKRITGTTHVFFDNPTTPKPEPPVSAQNVKPSEVPKGASEANSAPIASKKEAIADATPTPKAETSARAKNVPTAKADTPKHDYSSTQADLPPADASAVTRAASKIPDNVLAEDGREARPHVTVKYGLHGDDASEVAALLQDEPPITVTLGKTSLFENPEADVVKIDVDSPALHRLNAKIASLPNTDTFPDYKPHVTLAYVKPGEGARFKGMADLDGRTFTIDRVVFSDKNGKKTTIMLSGKETPPSPKAGTTSKPKTSATAKADATATTATIETPKGGISHEKIGQLREEIGWEPPAKTTKTDAELVEGATKLAGKEAAIADSIMAGDKSLTGEQSLALGVRLQKLKKEMRAAEKAKNVDAYDLARDEATKLADALDESGSRQGRDFRARQFVGQDDYSSWAIERRIVKEAKRDPTEIEKTFAREQAARDAEYAERIAKLEAENEELRAATIVTEMTRRRRVPVSIEAKRAMLSKERDEILTDLAKVTAQASAGIDPVLLAKAAPLMRKLAFNLVDSGVTEFRAVVEKLVELTGRTKDEIIAMLAHREEPTPRTLSAEAKARKEIIDQARARARQDRIHAESLEREAKNAVGALEHFNKAAAAKKAREKARRSAKEAKASIRRVQQGIREENLLNKKKRTAEAKLGEYEHALKTGDFEPWLKKQPAVKKSDAELENLRSMRDLLRRKVDARIRAMEPKNPAAKVVGEFTGAVRFVKLGTDAGALLRQGLYGALSHPGLYAKSVVRGLKAIPSDVAARQMERQIIGRKVGHVSMELVRRRAGLQITDSLTMPEEAFMSTWLKKIPGFGHFNAAAERFQTTLLNSLRAEMFDKFAMSADNLTKAELETYAQFVNAATGRSNLKKVPEFMNVIFTSPRYTLSRFEVALQAVKNPIKMFYDRGARESVKDLAKAGAVVYGALKAAEYAGLSVDFDPTSADFLKMRAGDNVYDPTSSVANAVRDTVRLWIYSQDPKFGKTPGDVAGRKFVNSLAPGVRTPLEAKSGKSLGGFELDESEKGWKQWAPLIVSQFAEDLETNNPRIAANLAAEFVGIGVTKYPRPKKK